MNYFHVDVFSNKPLSGNGLTVFICERELTTAFMQRITQEMRQFESIFLSRISNKEFRARVFTIEEELDFAGHPLLGSAAVLHGLHSNTENLCEWTFHLNQKTVQVKTLKKNGYFNSEMNQGEPEFKGVLNGNKASEFLQAFTLTTLISMKKHHLRLFLPDYLI